MASLLQFHSFGLHAHCKALVQADSPDDLLSAYTSDMPVYLLGEGSNTIFVEDFDGKVVVNRIMGIQHREQSAFHELTVGAGENWHEFVQLCVQSGWHGLENLALIPGTVGAAPIQNIGAYGVEVAQFVHAVTAFNLSTQEKHVFELL